MIFVTVGTNEAAFDRLLRHLDGVAASEELVVQHGASSVRPAGATCLDFLPFEDLVDMMRRARVVVTPPAAAGCEVPAPHLQAASSSPISDPPIL